MERRSAADLAAQNDLAVKFKALHIPGDPIILTNVHDAFSAQIVAAQPHCKAMASASWSIAATQGIDDDDLTFEQNLVGISNIVRGIRNAGKTATIPLSVDLQDGYDIPSTIRKVISLGCIGANIEDGDLSKAELRDQEDAVGRVRLALKIAEEEGVPDFVINARTDAFGYGGTMDDVQRRAKAYLDAGATTAFVWGVRKKDITVEEVRQLVESLDGRLAVQGPGPSKLSLEELVRAGVSRISFGPWLFREAMQKYGQSASALMAGQD